MYFCIFNGYHLFLANHTIAAIKGTESYTLLESLTDVIADVNDLIKNPILDGISLKVVLGGDYKVYAKVSQCEYKRNLNLFVINCSFCCCQWE